MIVGAENLGRSLSSPYGQLLLAKLALFALMLALAAANRWRLTPALAAAAGDDAESVDSDPDAALAAMRRSLIIEASAALAILVLVAWFGAREPFVAAAPVCPPQPPPGRVRSWSRSDRRGGGERGV